MYKFAFLLIIPVVLFFAFANKRSKKKQAPLVKQISASTAKGTVLLELFTSEGCSSCPAADALLPKWEKMDANVIPLSFHVDYWNRLGWKDPYSNEKYTQRQQDYARYWELESVYTPQLVINGTYELTGSNEQKAGDIITRQLEQKPEATIYIDSVSRKDDQFYFTGSVSGVTVSSVLNIALVEKENVSSVTAGENRGRNLHHHNVVRAFKETPAQARFNLNIQIPANLKGNCALICYIQRNDNKQVIAAVKRDIVID